MADVFHKVYRCAPVKYLFIKSSKKKSVGMSYGEETELILLTCLKKIVIKPNCFLYSGHLAAAS